MKFGYAVIYVADVEKTLDFYQKAFKLKLAFLHDRKQYGDLDTGDTKLAFASEVLSESNGVEFTKNTSHKPAAGFEIALVCDDVHEAYQVACKAGAVFAVLGGLTPIILTLFGKLFPKPSDVSLNIIIASGVCLMGLIFAKNKIQQSL